MQVLVRDRAHRLQPGRAEQLPLLERRQPVLVGEQLRQQVLSVDPNGAQPAEVVQPGVVEGRGRGVDPEGPGHPPAEPHRRVTDADHPVAEVGRHRLGDQAGRVGEVDDPGIREPPRRCDGRSGPRPGGCAGRRTLRPRRPSPARARPRAAPARSSSARPFEAAHPDRDEHEVGGGQRRVEVGGHLDHRRVGDAGCLLGEHLLDRRQPGGVEVVQRDVRDPALGAVGQQGPVDQGHAEATAAEDAQPHASITSTPASPNAVDRGGVGTRVGDDDVEVLRTAHPRHPGAWELADVGNEHDVVAGGDHGALDRHLDHRGVHHLAVGPDAAGAEEQPVGVHLTQVVLGQEADHRAVLPPQHAAEQHELDRRLVRQLLVDREVAGHHGQGPAAQLPGDPVRGGADVEQHGLAVLDQLGTATRDRVLLGDSHLRDVDEGVVAVAGEDGAAVDPPEQPLAVELAQVASDGRFTGAEQLRQAGHGGGTVGAQGAQDQFVASLGEHGSDLILQTQSSSRRNFEQSLAELAQSRA